MTTISARQVDVSDTTLHVQEAGEGHPLVFIHGMCGDAGGAAPRRPHRRRGAVRTACVLAGARGGPAVIGAGRARRPGGSTPEEAVDAFFEIVCGGLWASLPDARKGSYRANHEELFGDLQMPPMTVELEALRVVEVPVRLIVGGATHPAFADAVRSFAAGLPPS